MSDASDQQDEKRGHTDAALGGERATREYDRAGQRADTDAALGSERGFTDEERMVTSDHALNDWRSEHVDDDITATQKHAPVVPAWLNIAMIVLVLVWMALVTSQVIVSTGRISDINSRQILTVQQQNATQICAQSDIVTAVRKIGLKLGLPVEDIVPPDVTGLEC